MITDDRHAARRATPGSTLPVNPEHAQTDALTLGRRIRELRSALGMTLEELATAVDRAPWCRKTRCRWTVCSGNTSSAC